MIKFAVAVAAAALLLSTPTIAAPAATDGAQIRVAQADVSIRLGGDRRDMRRGVVERRVIRRGDRERCRMVTVRERRGGTVIVRKTRRCG
jgi:hypothetical protein